MSGKVLSIKVRFLGRYNGGFTQSKIPLSFCDLEQEKHFIVCLTDVFLALIFRTCLRIRDHSMRSLFVTIQEQGDEMTTERNT
jgi:hypothetical protein